MVALVFLDVVCDLRDGRAGYDGVFNNAPALRLGILETVARPLDATGPPLIGVVNTVEGVVRPSLRGVDSTREGTFVPCGVCGTCERVSGSIALDASLPVMMRWFISSFSSSVNAPLTTPSDRISSASRSFSVQAFHTRSALESNNCTHQGEYTPLLCSNAAYSS